MLRFLVLAFTWLLWSGHYTLHEPLIAAFGAVSCLAVTLLTQRMHAKAPRHDRDHTLTYRVLFYVPWLLKEIVISNLTVARIVLGPKVRVSPCVIRVPATQKGEGVRVLFANSITLTPGTISMATEPDAIIVHALTREIADALLTGEMDRRVSALEREV